MTALDIGNILDQLLASEIHNNFNLTNKITKKNCNPCEFYLPTQEKLALLKLLAQNL